MLAPAVKELIRIEDIARIPELVRRAFWLACSGRPGPVLLDVPEDIAHGEFDFPNDDLYAEERAKSIPSLRIRPDRDGVAMAAKMLSEAEKPMLLVGGGVHLSGAQETLTAFARAHNIPTAHTLSGKGGIACADPLSLGLFGRYSRIANEVMDAADCILVVGCKLGEIATKRYTLPPAGVPVIHLDVLAEEIGRTTKIDVPLWGDCKAGLEDIAEAIAATGVNMKEKLADYAADAAAAMQTWRAEVEARLTSDEIPVNMARLCHELNQNLPEDAILLADGGFAAHWTGLLCDTKTAGRHYIANRGFASIGYGLPGVMGAQLAAPDAPVVGVTGDGGFNMMIGDLETAKRLGTPFTLIIVNNAASGYVKALQHALFGGQYQSSDLHELNYAKLADGFGCEGIRVEEPGQLAAALKRGMANRDCPTIIDVVVTRDPAKMLPGVDNRAAPVKKGDRIA
jgi:acetolactate synthase-1/2/3 large subunit